MSRAPMVALLASLLGLHGLCAPVATTAQSREAEQGADDSREMPERIEWFIAKAHLGYRFLDLHKIEFEDDEGTHARLIPATPSGFSPGVGIGARFWFFTLMLRGDVTLMSEQTASPDTKLWTLDLEGSFRFSDRRLQPYLLLAAGYAALGGIGDVVEEVRRAADAQGVNVRLGLGADYYLSDVVTLGLRGTAEGLLMASHASALDLARPQTVDTLGETEARVRQADGSIAGLAYGLGISLGLHLP